MGLIVEIYDLVSSRKNELRKATILYFECTIELTENWNRNTQKQKTFIQVGL